jgi:hypothetical protein
MSLRAVSFQMRDADFTAKYCHYRRNSVNIEGCERPSNTLFSWEIMTNSRFLAGFVISGPSVRARLIVKFTYAPGKRFTHSCYSAGGIEGLVLDAINRHAFEPVKWQRRNAAALVQCFATLTLFVDQARGAPTQVVFHLVTGGQGQGAHPHFE